MPNGNDPAVVNVHQLSALSYALNSSIWGASFSDVANVSFVQGNENTANIVFGATTSGGTPPHDITSSDAAYELDSSTGWDELKHGDIWLNADSSFVWDLSDTGTLSYFTAMHELSHSLGLEDTINTSIANSVVDSQKYTIMSYKLLDGMNPGVSPNTEVTPFGLQLLDIAAIQAIYGTNWDTRSEDNTQYSKMTAFAFSHPNDAFIYTIWDGGGNGDTIDASGYVDGVKIDLREGHFSSIGKAADTTYAGSRGTGLADDNVAIAYKAQI